MKIQKFGDVTIHLDDSVVTMDKTNKVYIIEYKNTYTAKNGYGCIAALPANETMIKVEGFLYNGVI